MLLRRELLSDTVEQKVEEKRQEKKSVSHTVYALIDSDNKVQYVGRTVDPVARKNAHLNSSNRGHLKFIILASGLDYDTARGLEQSMMLYYHTLNTVNKANNQINGVSPSNPKREIYKAAAEGFIKYAENQISNEILYWIGR